MLNIVMTSADWDAPSATGESGLFCRDPVVAVLLTAVSLVDISSLADPWH